MSCHEKERSLGKVIYAHLRQTALLPPLPVEFREMQQFCRVPIRFYGNRGEKNEKRKIPSEIILVYNGWDPTRCQVPALYFFIFVGLNKPQAGCQVPVLFKLNLLQRKYHTWKKGLRSAGE